MACESEQIVKDAAQLLVMEAEEVLKLACKELEDCLNKENKSDGLRMAYHCARVREHLFEITGEK